MDIERLRKILKELNRIFWNPKIDRRLQEENCANHTPIQSSEKRYIIAICDFGPDQDLLAFPKSGPYRQIIRAEKSPEKKLRDRLFQEFQDCLTPYDKVYDILRKEFRGSFAEQVLLTHEDLIRNFSGISCRNHRDWGQLMVCMSHKDFWTTPPSRKQEKAGQGKASEQTGGTKETPSPIDVSHCANRKEGSLKKLRSIDEDDKRSGIQGDKTDLKRLREFLKRLHPPRSDWANLLYLDEDERRIKVNAPHRTMFKQK